MGIEVTANSSCFTFLHNKADLRFSFEQLKTELNHLEVKEVIETIEGAPDLQANHMCEFSDSQKIE